MVEWIEGLERKAKMRDCKVILGVVPGACSDRRTSGASSMRIILGVGVWPAVVDVREAIASSITARVWVNSVDVSLKVLYGVVCEACAGIAFDTDAP
jgi:hypothetical protein